TGAGPTRRRGGLNAGAFSDRPSASSYSITTTACARFSDAYAASDGIVTTRWQRSSASFVRPLSSRPKSRATGPLSASAAISLAASRTLQVAFGSAPPGREADDMNAVRERAREIVEELHPRKDILGLVRDALDPVRVVLPRRHEAQIRETEILHGPHHVRDVDELLGLVQHD